MYLRDECYITIGNYVLRGINECEIVKSIHVLIGTCVLQLPLNAVFRNEATATMQTLKLADALKEGDKVEVRLGYNGKLRTEFTGYVRRINYSQPLVIECEDELYMLRKVKMVQSFKNVTAKQIITAALDQLRNEHGVNILLFDGIPDIPIGNFYCKGNTAVWVLEELRKFGVHCFLVRINNVLTLYAGLQYGYNAGRVYYKFNSNTVSTDNLKYNNADDKKYRVTVVNFKKDGTQERETYGEEGGDQLTINVYNAAAAEMRQRAESEVQKLRVDGYKGDLETLLLPVAEPGMTADVHDPQFAERDGSYYVSTVTTYMGTNGTSRRVQLEVRLR